MITELITYLQGVSALTPSVRFAFTSEPVEDMSTGLPTIMVYPESYSAAASSTDNFINQTMTIDVVCLLGCAIDDYETYLGQLRSALIGWTTGDYDAFELSGASIVGIKGGYIWWKEVYSTREYLRQTI
jgi:hypothetical protein